MTDKISALLQFLKDKEYRKYRVHPDGFPVVYPIDFFGFHNGCEKPFDWDDGGNVTPDYPRIMANGFDKIRADIVKNIAAAEDEKKRAYGEKMLCEVDRILRISDAYRETVRENERLYAALQRVPHGSATTFYEACVFMKLCIYFLRAGKVGHIGLGRFDQYMYPYYQNDLQNGVEKEQLFETLEAFFISLNFDSDLYNGMQQGDNGQSMMLGGFDQEGNSVYNELSDLCMDASLELNLIDPKINLRVGKNTPFEIYRKATLLTKKGLGFPQYCNDDVVVPGLIKLGYEREDAVDYTVAACWEIIVPGKGADIPNIRTLNFPLVVNDAIREYLKECDDFEALMVKVEKAIGDKCDSIVQHHVGEKRKEQPLLSVFIDGCVEKLTDLWQGGAKYFNFGCHGAGIANATDALTAVKTCVFEQKTLSAQTLLAAMDADFEGYAGVRNLLRSCAKMGNNDDRADDIALRLLTCFSESLNGRDNGNGGIWRAGTGSAMEYINSARKCPATADGRRSGEPYSSSFSPSLDVKTNGLLSIIQSFTKYDMREIINGGPLTLEIHDSVLRNDIGIEKTAALVKLYIDRGGHQLQLNSINRELLLDAQKHPQNYQNLIVRVWGWSGYFNELDTAYQNHIIRRAEHLG